MTDPATKWFKIVLHNDKQIDTIAKLVEHIWLCRYPRPKIITYDRANELICHAFRNAPIKNEYGIKFKCATTANTQGNLILEKFIN